MVSSKEIKKITILSLESNVEVSAQYNPKEVSFQKDVEWADQESHGKDYPDLQFTAGKAVTVSLELLFDEYEEGGDVRKKIDKLMSLAKVMDDKKKRPPIVRLMWGGGDVLFNAPFTGVVSSLSTKYTMFTEAGVPCRAVATVSLRQADTVGANEGAKTSVKVEKVNKGSELPAIAKKHGISHEALLNANRIEDPMTFKGSVTIHVTQNTADNKKPPQKTVEV